MSSQITSFVTERVDEEVAVILQKHLITCVDSIYTACLLVNPRSLVCWTAILLVTLFMTHPKACIAGPCQA